MCKLFPDQSSVFRVPNDGKSNRPYQQRIKQVALKLKNRLKKMEDQY